MQKFKFLKGQKEATKQSPDDFVWDKAAQIVRAQISDAMNARHLSFLLGSGCSSMWQDGKAVRKKVGPSSC